VILGLFLLPSCGPLQGNRQDALEANRSANPGSLIIQAQSQLIFPRDSKLPDGYFQDQTRVKVRNQIGRPNCTAFSAVGAIELDLKSRTSQSFDLSEEWVSAQTVAAFGSVAAKSRDVFQRISEVGVLAETDLPYDGFVWSRVPEAHPDCLKLPEPRKSLCLEGHLDVNALNAPLDQGDLDPFVKNLRQRAMDSLQHSLEGFQGSRMLMNSDDVKRELTQGRPVVLDMNTFLQAWNHPKLSQFPGSKRDLSRWFRGVVSFLEKDSRDWEYFKTIPLMHSMQIVGYDDNLEVNATFQMRDGSEQTFTYRGVYIFRNSWGVEGFGRDFEYRGIKMPGYGMVTQAYAHEQGEFLGLVWKRSYLR
jgi:hypothetical protein